MDVYDEWTDSDEESEPSGDNDSKAFLYKPSYLLIAIDTDASMFETDDSRRSSFLDCVEACYQVANSLVMAEGSSVKGPLGIILAENEAAKAKFIEFDQAVPDTVNILKTLREQSISDLKAKYERKQSFDLADFFLLCKNKLLQINADVYKRTVIYVTNNDDPVQNDARKKFKIINESQKFPNMQMELNVVTFKPDFDYDHFYAEVLSASNSPPVEKIKNTEILTDKISNLIQTKYRKYRCKFYPFKTDTDSYVDVVINKFIKNSNIPKNMYVTRDTQKEVKKSVQQQKYSATYKCSYAKSEDPLIFTEAEKEKLSETNLPVGYTLLCVGKETARYGWVIESAVLMEKHHKETELLFESFWQFCKDNAKCLVCYRKYKKCGDVRLVEMVPRFVNNARMFLVRVLPFGPEIHMPALPRQDVKFEQNEEKAMAQLVDALTFSFHPNNFRDPVVAKKKAYIKSRLLDEPLEEVVDGIPPDKELDDRVAEHVQQLQRLNLVDMPPAAKRKLTAKGGSGARTQKRSKKSEEELGQKF